MDQNDKGEEMVHEEVSNIVSNHKSCVDCKTTKTPLWRSGPTGPKSLCNACGIRYRKKRTGITRVFNKHQEKKKFVGDDEKGTTNKRRKVSKYLRRRIMSLGKEVVVLQQPRSPMKRQKRKINHYWKKMGEVEQAAVLLMAMSCGSILALDRRIGNQIQGSQSIIP